jgi:hypothetical protein
MTRAVAMARGMAIMRQQFTGAILDGVCTLAGTPLGFLTDKDGDGKKYPKEIIRDCAIEAILRGARLTGNEFNIIAGKCYLTKAYFARQLAGLVEHLRVVEGVPQRAEGGALVPMVATWSYQGVEQMLDCTAHDGQDNRIPVKTDKYTGVDAILGKAHRKLYARIYRQVTGSSWAAEDEPDAGPAAFDPHLTGTLEARAEDGDQEGTAIDVILKTGSEARIRCDSLTGVDALEEAIVEKLDARGASDDTVERWRWLCAQRRSEIKGARGERSNQASNQGTDCQA